MANPNIATVSRIFPQSSTILLGNTPYQITAATGELIKIQRIGLSNIIGSRIAYASVWYYISNVSYRVASTIRVPQNTTVNVISKNTPLYLMEGQTLRVNCSTGNADLEMVLNYELFKDFE